MVLFSIFRGSDLSLCQYYNPHARLHHYYMRYVFHVLTKDVILGLLGLLGQDPRGGNLRDSYQLGCRS